MNEQIQKLNENLQTLRGWIQTNANNNGATLEQIEAMKVELKNLKAFQVSINPGGSGGTPSAGGVTSLNTLTGILNLIAGTNVTLTPVGNNITIDVVGGGEGGALDVYVTYKIITL